MEIITIYTAGVAKGNPGPASIGIEIDDANGKVLEEVSEMIGNATSNFAEYNALVKGLQIATDIFGKQTTELKFELKLSSELVKMQLNGELQINNPALVPQFIEIHNLRIISFPNLNIIHISESENKAMTKLFQVLDDK